MLRSSSQQRILHQPSSIFQIGLQLPWTCPLHRTSKSRHHELLSKYARVFHSSSTRTQLDGRRHNGNRYALASTGRAESRLLNRSYVLKNVTSSRNMTTDARNDIEADTKTKTDEVNKEEDDEEDRPYPDDKYSYDIDDLVELIDTRIQTVKTSAEAQSNATKTKAEHDRYWRSIFRQIQQEADCNPKIPTSLFKPELPEMFITFAAKQTPLRCPCCLPNNLPYITIWESTGVTKSVFVQKLSEALHGTDTSPPLIGSDTEKLVLKGFDWMYSGSFMLGRTVYVYCDGLSAEGYDYMDDYDEVET